MAEKEECWYKDGVSRTENTVYEGTNANSSIVCVNYNEHYVYVLENNNIKKDLDFEEFVFINDYDEGKQLYIKLPNILKRKNVSTYIWSCLNFSLNAMNINVWNDDIVINTSVNNVLLAKDSLLPKIFYDNSQGKITTFNIELNSVNDIRI